MLSGEEKVGGSRKAPGVLLQVTISPEMVHSTLTTMRKALTEGYLPAMRPLLELKGT